MGLGWDGMGVDRLGWVLAGIGWEGDGSDGQDCHNGDGRG